MQIRIGKRDKGVSNVAVIPSRRRHLPAVKVWGVAKGNMRTVLRDLIWKADGKVPPDKSVPS